MVLLHMVCHGSHQYTPVMLADIPAPAGSVMGALSTHDPLNADLDHGHPCAPSVLLRYRIPQDIAPYKDELGEWHPPRLSGRYKAQGVRESTNGEKI